MKKFKSTIVVICVLLVLLVSIVISVRAADVWEKTTDIKTLPITDISSGKGKFVVIGENGTVLLSENGISWKKVDSGVKTNLTTIIYDGKRFIAGGDEGVIITSIDGAKWTKQKSGTDLDIRYLYYDNKTIWAVGHNRNVYSGKNITLSSNDGIKWALKKNDINNFNVDSITATAYNEKFYIGFHVWANGTDGSLRLSSKDGATWNKIGGNDYFPYVNSIIYQNNEFIVATEEGLMTSQDGLDWKTLYSEQAVEDVAFINGKYYACTYSSIISSSDGVKWDESELISQSERSSSIGAYLQNIEFNGKTIVAISYNGTIYYSNISKTNADGINQKEKNITAMLTTHSSNVSYWDYFADSNRYPYYIYLDNYYSAKDSLPFLKGAESFFRINIAPSLIGAADVIYNDKALEGQSKERSKKILLSMIKKSGDEWMNSSLTNSSNELIEELLSYAKSEIKNDKATFEKKFDNNYTKLDELIKNLKIEMKNKTKAGRKPNVEMLLESKQLEGLYKDKNDLIKKLESKMKLYNNKQLDKLTGRIGIVLDISNFVNVSTSEYQDICNLLQADSEFIDFLTFLEKNSNTLEIQQAAKELREYFLNELAKKTNAFVDSVSKGGIAFVEDFIKGASCQVAFATFAVDTITNVGDKIDYFEKLRLTSSMSITLDNEMKNAINKFNKPNLSSDKEDAINSIYKYAPFLFALRIEGGTDLFEYLKVIGGDVVEEKANMNSVNTGIDTLHNTFYKEIGSIMNSSIGWTCAIRSDDDDSITAVKDGHLYLISNKVPDDLRDYDIAEKEGANLYKLTIPKMLSLKEFYNNGYFIDNYGNLYQDDDSYLVKNNVKQVSGNDAQWVLTNDGSLWRTGYPDYDHISLDDKGLGKIMEGVTSISANSDNKIVVLKYDKSLWLLEIEDDQGGIIKSKKIMEGTNIVQIACCNLGVYTMDEEGIVWYVSFYDSTKKYHIIDDALNISKGKYYIYITKKDGSLWQDFSELIKLMDGVQKFINTDYRTGLSFAVKTDGSLWVWSEYGEHTVNGVSIEPNEPIKISN